MAGGRAGGIRAGCRVVDVLPGRPLGQVHPRRAGMQPQPEGRGRSGGGRAGAAGDCGSGQAADRRCRREPIATTSKLCRTALPGSRGQRAQQYLHQRRAVIQRRVGSRLLESNQRGDARQPRHGWSSCGRRPSSSSFAQRPGGQGLVRGAGGARSGFPRRGRARKRAADRRTYAGAVPLRQPLPGGRALGRGRGRAQHGDGRTTETRVRGVRTPNRDARLRVPGRRVRPSDRMA